MAEDNQDKTEIEGEEKSKRIGPNDEPD